MGFPVPVLLARVPEVYRQIFTVIHRFGKKERVKGAEIRGLSTGERVNNG